IVTGAADIEHACGCTGDDSAEVAKIRAKRQARRRTAAQTDHAGRVKALLSQGINQDWTSGANRVTFHVENWLQQLDIAVAETGEEAEVSPLYKTLPAIASQNEEFLTRLKQAQFQLADFEFLRDQYLFAKTAAIIDAGDSTDPLLSDWLAGLTTGESPISDEDAAQLRSACRLFDWTIRNIRLEPAKLGFPPDLQPKPIDLRATGMTLQGPGYRQRVVETLFRASGDGLQRSRVFLNLCYQLGIEGCMLTVPVENSPGRIAYAPWMAAVRIADQLYLFDCNFGISPQAPNGEGIATLQQARTDDAVLRRMTIQGFDRFQYGVDSKAIQQCVAMLDANSMFLAPRMKALQRAIDQSGKGPKFRVSRDVDAAAKRIDDVAGIAGVRLWEVPLLSQLYRMRIQRAMRDDPILLKVLTTPWIMLESPNQDAQQLRDARWMHLTGRYENVDSLSGDSAGAIVKYVQLRKPEFEIEDLLIDTELQKEYGVRLVPGMKKSKHRVLLLEVQDTIRRTKQTGT
ncbi:MAG: hypothetical protein AAFN70_12370, partial [Planctomycetota bacterium]